MMRFACLALCCAFVACGDGQKVEGSLVNLSFSNAEAIFAVIDASLDANATASGQVGIVLLSSTPGTCAALAKGHYNANTAWALGFLYDRPDASTLEFDVGSYALETQSVIAAQYKAGDPRPQRVGYGNVFAFDASGSTQDDGPDTITGGTANVISIDPNKSMKLNFEITTDANDQLQGSLTAVYCDALAALFGGSDATTSSNAAMRARLTP
jgi:hypothetical protein